MDHRTALGRDLVRTVIGWRLRECLLFLPTDHLDDETDLDRTCTAARERFVERLTDVAYGAPPVTAAEAESMLAPLAAAIAAALNEGRTSPDAARRERIERAGLIGLARATAPVAARFCTEPRQETFDDAEALGAIIAESDLLREDLDDVARHRLLRRRTTPEAYRARMNDYLRQALDAKPLLAEITAAFRREFTDDAEYADIADTFALDDAAQFAADVDDFRTDRCTEIICSAIDETWPRD
jgi:hypothetical protein